MSKANNPKTQGKTLSFPLIDESVIAPFNSDYCYMDYKKKVLEDFRNVKTFFPTLEICILPTVKPREIFIYGWLVPKDLGLLLSPEEDFKRYGIYIIALYPSKFPDDDITVEDINRTINWSLVPDRHRHRKTINGRNTGLCTHHPDGEINSVSRDNRSVKILMSAWKLFFQYSKYVETGKWELEDLPHGEAARAFL